RIAPPQHFPRLAYRRHPWLAAARGDGARSRPHRARHAARVRLPAHLAQARPRDLGQSLHDAPRAPLRRQALPARYAAADLAGLRADARTAGLSARPAKAGEPYPDRWRAERYLR